MFQQITVRFKPYFRMTILIAWMSLLVSSVFAGGEVDSDRVILDEVSETYTTLRSYTDSGVISQNHFLNGKLVETERSRFSTFFSRPDKLRFEWIDESDKFGLNYAIIWRNETEIYTFSGKGTLKRRRDITAALSAIGGRSRGVSYIVPALLSPTISGRIFQRAEEFDQATVTMPDGQLYRLLTISYTDNLVDRIWISESTKLIRRLERWSIREDSRVQTIVEYVDVKANPVIEPSTFVVNPNYVPNG